MFEFLVLLQQGHKLAEMARGGKQSATRWVCYLVGMWFMAEFVGICLGFVVGYLIGGDGLGILVGYVAGLLSALAAQRSVFRELRRQIFLDEETTRTIPGSVP